MKFKVQRNDITNMRVDAIVLPANPHLAEGPGVSVAVFGKAGRERLMADCAKLGEVEVGKAVVTEAYALPCKYIIHAVVPRRGDADSYQEDCELLSKAYLSALRLADQLKCASLAIPLLSAGNNGFELDVAAQVAINSLSVYEPQYNLQDVILTVYNSQANFHMIRLDYDVEQVIDQEYVDKQDNTFKPLIVHQMEGVINGVVQAVGDGMAAIGGFFGAGAKVAGDAVAGAAKAAGDAAQAASDFVNENEIVQKALAEMAEVAVELALKRHFGG